MRSHRCASLSKVGRRTSPRSGASAGYQPSRIPCGLFPTLTASRLPSHRSLVTSCSGGKPSKDAVALHKWVINQAETMEELCGELTWAQCVLSASPFR